ncbi:hydrolase [Lactobacillus pentosus] [Lactiplantibacillus mudanjiangensis]|uniref:alpha/beta hydrolase n=1 Tax=Lactiplantibacillus mudanjiangensis TaxID=1296538 RepID=UPI0010157C80|nr:hydrolase [Lactobacillus pentosus] [Lactiplantibacillus mudanjiangensis]
MKGTTKQGLITTGWFTILIAVIGGTMLWQRQVRRPKHQVEAVTVTSTDRIPTVLLLGQQTSAAHSRELVAGLQQNNGAQSIVQVQVNRQGDLKFRGQFQTYDNRPYLKINLPKGDITTKQQAKWLKFALQQARRRFKFKHFNLISYGDGGLVATQYLMQTSAALTPKNLVAVATPFNGLSTHTNSDETTAVDTAHQTATLKSFIAQRSKLQRHVRVLLVAGHAKHKSFGDGVVPIQSALAGQSIFRNHVTQYDQQVIHTWRASHARLFNSWRLVNKIQSFMN